MSGPTDDLAGVFASATGVAPDPARRNATLRATAGVIRRGRWIRRGLVGVSTIAVFIAGGVVGWGVKPPATPAAVPPPQPSTESPSPVPPVVPTAPLSPERLELLAEMADEPNEAARLYREAGDRFLTDRDYENAARCYRRHLTAADARTPSESDSWMLQSMKTRIR